MKHNIIGAGRLGKNIAMALIHTKSNSLTAICNRSMDSAKATCEELGAGQAIQKLQELPLADVTWITTKDDTISSIVSILAHDNLLPPGSMVIHCSGVLNSTILAPLKEQGCMVGSVHPLKAFKSGYKEGNAFADVHCVLEGDDKVCEWLHTFFTSLSAQLITLTPKAKASYHAAATIASNYLITLASYSEQLLVQSGIKKEQARQMICHLMQGNINNLQQTPNLPDALTGPLMRGDIETLALHLKAIENPLCLELYKVAGLATLPLTSLKTDTKECIKELFV